VVGFAAGAVTDTAARTIAESLKENLPNEVDVVVENKPGGGAIVGVTEVVNAKPDGYTIGFIPDGPLTLQTHYGNTTYDYEEVTLLSQTSQSDLIMAVHVDSPWNDFDEFLEEARDNPGTLKIGTPGSGTMPDLTVTQMMEETGAEVTTVPFEGNAPARTALLGKDVDAILLSETDILPYAAGENADIVPIMNFGVEKFDEFPDLPVALDEGIDVSEVASFLFIGPQDLPDEISSILDNAIKKSLEDPKVMEAYEKIGLRIHHRSPDKIKQLLDESYERYGELIQH